MNSWPMIFRLRSGSATRSSFFRKRFEASTKTTLRCSRSANRRLTCSASSLRSSPLSTNTQVSRLPIARWTMRAATAESTPPERAQMTRPFGPTCSRTRSVASSTNDRAFQSRRQPHTSRKFARTFEPSSVWTTSGWNSIPYSRRAGSSTAAMAFVSVAPTTRKPEGARRTSSPWLIQTRLRGGMPRKRLPPGFGENSAWPYSRWPDRFTSPPRTWLMSCMP